MSHGKSSATITPDLVAKLRERYHYLHPLVFLRSVGYASDDGSLFEILESTPKGFPLTWDEANRCWVSLASPLSY